MSEEIKVSEMQEAEEVNDEDIVMVIQKKVNKKAKIKQIKNELAVSPTQPTTREKVWFKIGKNKFDKLGYIENIETGKSRTINLKLEPNTTYTMSSNISKTSNNTADLFFASGYNASVSTDANGVWNGQSRTVTSDKNGYVTVAYRKQSSSQAPNLIDAWYQIEQGSTATTYEEYVEPVIYVKNASGVFEEFYNKNFFKTEELVITSKLSGFNVTGYRFGKLCLVFFEGSAEAVSKTWTAYKLGEIIGVTAANTMSSTFVNQVGQSGDVTIIKNSNEIHLNYRAVTPTPKNSWIRGQLLFACN